MRFTLKKKSSIIKGANREKKYILFTDLSIKESNNPKHVIRFDTFEDIVKNKEVPKTVKWLLENTNLSPELIVLAEENPGIPIPLAFDAVKYAKKIKCIHTGVPAYMNNIMKVANEEANAAWLKQHRKDLFKDDNSGEDKK